MKQIIYIFDMIFDMNQFFLQLLRVNLIEKVREYVQEVVMKDFNGCPGSRSFTIEENQGGQTVEQRVDSHLTHWPIQLHLISPTAPQYQEAHVILAADCAAFACGNFHSDFMKGKAIAIACPKLDGGQDVYLKKIRAWVDEAKIESLTVAIMQVPCCRGLVGMTAMAVHEAEREIPVKYTVLGFKGEIIEEGDVTSSDAIW